MPVIESPELYEIPEIATYCKVDDRTVRSWIRAGRLRAVKLSPGTVRITADDLAAFIEAGRS